MNTCTVTLAEAEPHDARIQILAASDASAIAAAIAMTAPGAARARITNARGQP